MHPTSVRIIEVKRLGELAKPVELLNFRRLNVLECSPSRELQASAGGLLSCCNPCNL